MFDFKEIRKLVRLLENSQISEIEIAGKDGGVRLKKIQPTPSSSKVIPQNKPPESVPADPSIIDSSIEETSQVDVNTVEVTSPMVGTFYAAPAPDAEPYVQLGDTIEEGQVVCIIEAMKLMNEIESEVNGWLAEIRVENAQPVEYGQVLFIVQKE